MLLDIFISVHTYTHGSQGCFILSFSALLFQGLSCAPLPSSVCPRPSFSAAPRGEEQWGRGGGFAELGGGSPPPHTPRCLQVCALRSFHLGCMSAPRAERCGTQPHICNEDGAASLYKYTSITGTSAPSVPPSHTIPKQPPPTPNCRSELGGGPLLDVLSRVG